MRVLHTQEDLKPLKPNLLSICARTFALGRNTRIAASCFSKNVITLHSLYFVINIVVIIPKCLEIQYATCTQCYNAKLHTGCNFIHIVYATLSWASIVILYKDFERLTINNTLQDL